MPISGFERELANALMLMYALMVCFGGWLIVVAGIVAMWAVLRRWGER